MDLNKSSKELLEEVSKNGQNKEAYITLAIAAAIASTIVPPSSEVGNYNMWFRSMHQIDVLEMISKVNEVVLVDTDSIFKYTQDFLAIRLNAIFTPQSILTTRKNALNSLLGVTKYLDEVALAAIDVNGFMFCHIYNKTRAFIKPDLATDACGNGILSGVN